MYYEMDTAVAITIHFQLLCNICNKSVLKRRVLKIAGTGYRAAATDKMNMNRGQFVCLRERHTRHQTQRGHKRH